MKNIFILIVFLTCFLLMPESVSAQTKFDGTYQGKISHLRVKGKAYPDELATFILKDNNLHCDFPKIGKMPGNITLDIPVQAQPTDGKLISSSDIIGKMSFLVSTIKLKKVAFEEAGINPQDELHFKLSLYGRYLFLKFPVSFVFDGKRVK